jgi:hypothetical protein
MSWKRAGLAHKRAMIAQARSRLPSSTLADIIEKVNVSGTLTHGCAPNTVMVANSLINAVRIFLNIHFGRQ